MNRNINADSEVAEIAESWQTLRKVGEVAESSRKSAKFVNIYKLSIIFKNI